MANKMLTLLACALSSGVMGVQLAVRQVFDQIALVVWSKY